MLHKYHEEGSHTPHSALLGLESPPAGMCEPLLLRSWLVLRRLQAPPPWRQYTRCFTAVFRHRNSNTDDLFCKSLVHLTAATLCQAWMHTTSRKACTRTRRSSHPSFQCVVQYKGAQMTDLRRSASCAAASCCAVLSAVAALLFACAFVSRMYLCAFCMSSSPSL